MFNAHRLFLVTCVVGFAGCAELPSSATAPDAGTTRPAARPALAALPPPTARTVEQFDTTTAADRAAAKSVAASGAEVELGRTIASLGNPAEPGFWLETPLVSAIKPGRVVTGAGKSVALELRPNSGPASAGSRLSLAAMRLLGVGLTDLPELVVFSAR